MASTRLGRIRHAFPAVALVLAAGGFAAAAPTTAVAAASASICTSNVKATGVSGLWLEVPGTSSGSSTCFLEQGDNSEAVRALQYSMNRCYGKALTLDGDFGPATRSALISVQKAIGAAQDGGYGTETRGKMLHAGTVNGCQKWSHDGWT
ncbi:MULTISPECIES: peptidoglycan-binding protein [unclassified Streptomyces]|uniref:peptidoglycan-binding domain-containing protein n=1 Tax=unclassified Streptomyces TaxID=2593676 RepID=UPI003817EA6C